MRLQALKTNKYSVLFLILVIFVFVEVIVMSPSLLEKNNDEYGEIEKNIIAPEDKKNAVEQKMRGFHLVESGENEKNWELFANEAVGMADSQWILKNVKIQFFNENKSSFIVTGDIGEIEGISKDMIIRGHVITSSSNGYTFKTDTLRYVSKQKIMTSDDAVVMEGPNDESGKGFRLTGEKLLVDIVENKMSILDKIFATKLIKGKHFQLTSVRADFSNNNQEATFSGDVKMNLGVFYVQAPVANFYYSNINKTLVKIILKQGVTFTDSNRKGTCEVLEMDLIENKITMRGQPKVQQGADEIKGQEIVFIDGGKKVKINKNKTNQQGKK